MEQIAFLMRLKPGCDKEYRRRHDEIWPELKTALTQPESATISSVSLK